MTWARTIARVFLLAFLGLTLAAQTLHQQHHPPRSTEEYIRALEDPGREAWQKPERVVKALEISPGQVVADLGAGSGYFTLRFARAVGDRGKVYAVDVEPKMLEYLAARAREEKISNIEIIRAEAHDPKLPAAGLDLIFICDTIHHVENRTTYYPLLARTLKPGGRLVIVDFHKRPLPVGPPPAMKITRKDMMGELEQAGFKIEREFNFLPYQYFLVFELRN